ncbi:DUF6489 family protein [Ferruginivarius sediminum]|uniref:Ribosomal protein S1 n=1 Tax=Ferruginivarius sediminum TaxID=2661937 RepID=A0A369TFH3_9PROT|nr:DUF6489 family protein [Ferruginivarius sediminum]RDD63572.1 hypothetical protein DRB17_02070 [Ferruginivarius sediminum]
MKIRVDVECTPEEARRFLGLPDVTGLNEAVTNSLQQRIDEAIQTMDTDTLLRTWLPAGTETWRQMQESFWKHLASVAQEKTGRGGKGEGNE